MGAGLPDFVVVNLDDLEKHFAAGEQVSLEQVKAKIMDVSGRDARLPLKVRGRAGGRSAAWWRMWALGGCVWGWGREHNLCLPAWACWAGC